VKQTKMEERRKFFRLRASVNVSYTKRKATEEEKSTSSKDISRGGICLIVNEELQESDLLDLKISLPRYTKPIYAAGRVVWIKEITVGDVSRGKKFYSGIEFIKIDERDAKEIEKFVFAERV